MASDFPGVGHRYLVDFQAFKVILSFASDTSLTYTFTQASVHSIVLCRVSDGLDSTTASWEFAVVSVSDAVGASGARSEKARSRVPPCSRRYG